MRRLIVMAFATLATLPVAAAQTRPPSFVDAASVVPGLVVEMRYFGPDNFVGIAIDGYERPVCLLTRQAAAALAEVARDLEPRGLALKVFDCYRPARAVAHFVRWARNVADVARKAEFYPDLDKRELFKRGYIATRSGHSRGSTVDITLVQSADGQKNGQKNGQELDMGTPFDVFSPRAWPSDRGVGAQARANRMVLADAMRRRGFAPYGKEWWHFTLANEPFRGTIFDFPVR